MTIETIDDAARLLDEKMPGWKARIGLDYLDMDDVDYCILGQLYGSYVNGLLELGFKDDETAPKPFGSNMHMHEDNEDYNDKLTKEWKAWFVKNVPGTKAEIIFSNDELRILFKEVKNVELKLKIAEMLL